MNRYHSMIFIFVVTLAVSPAYSEARDPRIQAEADTVAIEACAMCHGPQGHSISPMFPVLAGQNANYLAAQLHAFKDKTRGDPGAAGYMWGMASSLDDDSITALAKYYSHQMPRGGPKVTGKATLLGRNIYSNGDVAKGIPACAACHGAIAEGNDSVPRLAGQHAQYLARQMRAFQDNLRDVAVMHEALRGMNGEAVAAVATYVQSLGP